VTGKESAGAISKAMSSNKGSVGILFEVPIPIHICKHFVGGHIPEQAQFKVIVQEGKVKDIF
jgi:hypothetical protein